MQCGLVAVLLVAQCSYAAAAVTIEMTDVMRLPSAFAGNTVCKRLRSSVFQTCAVPPDPMQNIFLTNQRYVLVGRRGKDVRRVGREHWGEKCHLRYLCLRHWRDGASAGSSPLSMVAHAEHEDASCRRCLKS
jgi:hypothetical protein